MRELRFRIVNVFAEQRLGGNPLCVFEDGRELDDAAMQAQFNLSETTFVLSSERASARVRIFTPTFEMPFAGHPTLGTAHVVRDLRGGGDAVTLEMKAGVIPVRARGDVWTLEANAPRHRPVAATRAELAAMLGLAEADVAPDASRPPLWVDTGSEQLIVPFGSRDAVARAAPRADLLERHGSNGQRAMAYVFHVSGESRRLAPRDRRAAAPAARDRAGRCRRSAVPARARGERRAAHFRLRPCRRAGPRDAEPVADDIGCYTFAAGAESTRAYAAALWIGR
jgi:PhzF family phenazine biosynthesis protein